MNSTNPFASSETRAKAIETRNKNLTPLFNLNRLVQRKNRIHTQIYNLNTELVGLQKNIDEILVHIGANSQDTNSVHTRKTVGEVVKEYLTTQSAPKSCTEIARAINCKYPATSAALRYSTRTFKQDGNKLWSLNA